MASPEKPEGEKSQSLPKPSVFGSLLYPFKVIVLPFKALREMTHSHSPVSILPGFLLVIALNIAVLASTAYVRASKIFLDSGTQSAGLLGADFIGTTLLPMLLQSLLGLILSWVTYAGILFLIARFFGKKSIAMNVFLMVVGYTFSVLVVYGLITTLLVSLLPEIHFEISIWQSGTSEEISNIYNAVWGTTVVFKLMDYLGLVFMFWLVFLGAIIVRASHEVSWINAIVFSFSAYFASSMLSALVSLLI